jgi:hypothetical protein
MMTLDGIASTASILVQGEKRGQRRCGASPPTSDAALRQKRRRPEGVARRAMMMILSNVIML